MFFAGGRRRRGNYLTVFIRLNAASPITFCAIRVGCLHEGGVHLKSNLFLASNSEVTDRVSFEKQKHVPVLV